MRTSDYPSGSEKPNQGRHLSRRGGAGARLNPDVCVLFITRTYPPAVGGMEAFAHAFYTHYRRVGSMDLLAHRGSRVGLIGFGLRVLMVLALRGRRYRIIHLYDGVLAPLVPLIRLLSGARLSCTVNGLDIVYRHFGYQRWNPHFLRGMDRIFPISRATFRQCEMRGVPAARMTVIPVGIGPAIGGAAPAELASSAVSSLGSTVRGKKVLLTVGRLVPRKGHAWFVEHVMPLLPARYVYVIAGDGPEHSDLGRRIRRAHLSHRVFLMGEVSEAGKHRLYELAHLFVMPNVHIEGDHEGFGIVALEAGVHSVPVVASAVEGLEDSVVPGVTGRLVPERDAEAFAGAILRPGIDRSALAHEVASRFGWPGVIRAYRREFGRLLSPTDGPASNDR